MRGLLALVAALSVPACDTQMQEPAPLPPDSFAFAVFGDGPYLAWEMGRYRRVIRDVNRTDLAWFLHVGDMLWFPCSDDAYGGRLASMNAIRHPVIYTPGDNEWSDCDESAPGLFEPLERLGRIREMFFADPTRSLGGRKLHLETQASVPAFREFVENARWRYGGFLFATMHLVGSDRPIESRPVAIQREAARRMEAALAWMDTAFVLAAAEDRHGVVLVLHGDPRLGPGERITPGYEDFVRRLEHHVRTFPGQVVMIHGDGHDYGVDHPLIDPGTGRPFAKLTRLETFGSPDIGWVRVALDSVRGRVALVEPRLTEWWWLF